MTSKERKEREREEMRALILDAASEIIAAEGIEKLSVRKIASRIEYSPGIIYHYFKDKDDIVNNVMGRGYQKIVSTLTSVGVSENTPEKKLRESTRGYIEAALKMPEEYKSVQLSSSPEILKYTSSLFQGASSKKPALSLLCKNLKELFKDKDIDEGMLELTAQVIAVSSFGFILKLIIERDIDEKQRERLIEHFLKCIVDGLILGKPLQEILTKQRGGAEQ